jgi:hypothetical protein
MIRMSAQKPAITFAMIVAAVLSIATGSAVRAESAFDAAVKTYKTGNYRQALAQFMTLKKAYPGNATVHYYLALCHQGAGHVSQAKAEYEWLIANDNTSIRPMAERALQQLGGGVAASSSRSGQSSLSLPASAQRAKVQTILEFYVECANCKRLDPMFSAVQSKFPDVVFKKVMAEEPASAELVKRFNVTTHPRLIYLDATGKVLQNNRTFPGSIQSLERQIGQFR